MVAAYHFRQFRLVLTVLPMLLALGTPAHATMVEAKSFAALCAEADMIFGARVDTVRSQRVDDAHADIETLVTFTDIDPILGVSGSSVTLRFAGGVVDGVREEFLGVPRFTPGERVVLFARNGYQLSPIVGMSQGCFRVIASDGGTAVADADGRLLAARAAGVEGGQAASGGALQLSEFLNAVRGELRAQGRSH